MTICRSLRTRSVAGRKQDARPFVMHDGSFKYSGLGESARRWMVMQQCGHYS